MIRRMLLSLMLLMPSLVLFAQEAAEAEAEGHGGHGWMAPIWHVPMIYWQIANVVLVVILFVVLLRRPAPAFFASRAGEIHDLLEKAVREKEEANRRLAEVEAKMGRLGEEVAAIEKAARESAESDRQRVIAEAEAAKERLQREAHDEVERRISEARRELKAFAADTAIAMARELLSGAVNADDEARLQAKFVKMLEEEAHERRG